MIVQNLALDGFRNYDRASVSFCPGVNVICGENAQGKTNLLEAVFYLSGARSHRARADRELIGFDRDTASLSAHIFSRARDFTVEAILRRGARRTLTVNGVKLRAAAELSGVMHTVLFCPEDLMLIREGASARRKFMDLSLCQLRPRYAAALAEYRRLYEHKTRILRDQEEKPSLLDTLDDFSQRMARIGAILIHYRARYCRELSGQAALIHQDFSGGREILKLRYQTVSSLSNPLQPASALYPLLWEHMQNHRQAELESRCCLSGPHKDDIEVELGGRSARQFASQGQARTAALSLKLADRELHREDTGEYPVLLLDDVLSELDRKRQSFVLNRIKGGQVFITCCEEEKLEALDAGAAFRVEHGSIRST